MKKQNVDWSEISNKKIFERESYLGQSLRIGTKKYKNIFEKGDWWFTENENKVIKNEEIQKIESKWFDILLNENIDIKKEDATLDVIKPVDTSSKKETDDNFNNEVVGKPSNVINSSVKPVVQVNKQIKEKKRLKPLSRLKQKKNS